ncbi:hypothetical protein PFDG_04218 [Plasmodium falciparum Dd2]|uniref:Uncharacterized protein n=1 Tax=Plasmodium falciparum (isolate Dd2) TaxID=57267 RepID=A0A0L7M4H5_PLAF4|nr:hypothetical protein PFDG_04218 [Plasmodium falciparum Dd2]
MEKINENNTSDIESDNGEVEVHEIYNKSNFINGRGARLVRILSEFVGVQDALRDEGIFFTVVVFGSSRSLSQEKYESKKRNLGRKLEKFKEQITNNIAIDEEELKECEKLKKEFRKIRKIKMDRGIL